MAAYTLHDEAPVETNYGPVFEYLPGAMVGDPGETVGKAVVMFSSLGRKGAPVYIMDDAPRVFTDSMEPPGVFVGYHYDGRVEPYKRRKGAA